MMRAKSISIDFVDDETGSLNSHLKTLFLYMICGVFCGTPHIFFLFTIGLFEFETYVDRQTVCILSNADDWLSNFVFDNGVAVDV